ncbi:IS630 family transposase, partial [Spartinivicinus marinus]
EIVAQVLKVSKEAVRQWLNVYLSSGIKGLLDKHRSGRPSKLTKSQRKELCKLIKDGPGKSGFPGACWRSPMIQHLIKERFNVFYSAKYLSELLKSLGFSFQKAKFVASKQNKEKRQEWLERQWPEILKRAGKVNAYVLFGDECSFPQWGTLSYTWAPIGQQPVIETTGKRKGYKVFGLIDYFTGRFFSKGVEGRLNGECYIEFLKEVLKNTRKPIILIQDGAPYHKGAVVKDFIKKHEKRISVYNLPSYSPDYNPIEMLWKKIKEKGTHLQYFPTFEDLVGKVNEMLVKFENAPKEILNLFGLYDELLDA